MYLSINSTRRHPRNCAEPCSIYFEIILAGFLLHAAPLHIAPFPSASVAIFAQQQDPARAQADCSGHTHTCTGASRVSYESAQLCMCVITELDLGDVLLLCHPVVALGESCLLASPGRRSFSKRAGLPCLCGLLRGGKESLSAAAMRHHPPLVMRNPEFEVRVSDFLSSTASLKIFRTQLELRTR
jgi:hypothetical protein